MVSSMAVESLDASRTHLEGLVHAVTVAGGRYLFNSYILDSAILLDKYLAIATMKPPMLLLNGIRVRWQTTSEISSA